MFRLEATQTVPLSLGEDGAIRITGSRVTLDSVVDEFKRGATAEQIQDDFPSLSLRDIYAAIGYYLERIDEVEQYLRERSTQADTTRLFIEERLPTGRLRRRLQQRLYPLAKPLMT